MVPVERKGTAHGAQTGKSSRASPGNRRELRRVNCRDNSDQPPSTLDLAGRRLDISGQEHVPDRRRCSRRVAAGALAD